MIRYALKLQDYEDAGRKRATRALIDSMVEGQDESGEVVTIEGKSAVVLSGTEAHVAAVVAGLLENGVKVYGEIVGRWQRVTEAPAMPDVPDETVELAPDEDHPRIDPEFAGLCGMLTTDERAGLRASLREHGCREPLVVWKEKEVLLDGHNRIAICRELCITYRTVEYSFATRDAARNWIIDNALARRSLTREQRDYLIGKRYAAQKKDPAATQIGSLESRRGQSDHAGKTANALAVASGVSEKTVRRCAEYAEAVDRVAVTAGQQVRAAILSGQVKVTREQLVRAADHGVRSIDELRAERRRVPAAVTPAPDPLAELAAAAARLERAIAACRATGVDEPSIAAVPAMRSLEAAWAAPRAVREASTHA